VKVTSKMVSRWVKAGFLATVGLVLAIYAERFVSDLEEALFEALDLQFAGTWDMLWLLLWVLIAWLFVLAIITVVLSFKEDAHTISDVMALLGSIENKLTSMNDDAAEDGSREAHQEVPPRVQEYESIPEPAFQEEVPPPPGE